jgi:DNA-binding PadR family transcriptional regulator
MNGQWDADHFQRMAMRFAQKFGRQQQRWAHRASSGFGAAMRGGKMLADGDLRLIVLVLLEDGPRHGYDIIKALEEKSSGIYSPSPGVVYPTLTYLEEAGYTTATSDGNKRVYSITDAGRAYLAENREAADSILKQMAWIGERIAGARSWAESGGGWGGRDRGGDDRRSGSERTREEPESPALAVLDKARRRLRALIADAIEAGDDHERQRLADILNRAADEALGKTGGTPTA